MADKEERTDDFGITPEELYKTITDLVEKKFSGNIEIQVVRGQIKKKIRVSKFWKLGGEQKR